MPIHSKILRCSLVAILAAVGCKAKTSQSGEGSSVSLIGGTFDKANRYNATVVFRSGCTATRVAKATLLTAAHCVVDAFAEGASAMTILDEFRPGASLQLSGANHITDDSYRAYTVKGVLVAPRFENRIRSNLQFSGKALNPFPFDDLALVYLDSNFSLAEDIGIASVGGEYINASPSADNLIENREKVTIVGAGCQVQRNGPTETVRVRKMKDTVVIDQTHLNGFQAVTPDYFRYYLLTPGNQDRELGALDCENASTCPGDSGGPLYEISTAQKMDALAQPNSKLVVVGVHSTSYFMKTANIKGVSSVNLHSRVDLTGPGGRWLHCMLQQDERQAFSALEQIHQTSCRNLQSQKLQAIELGVDADVSAVVTEGGGEQGSPMRPPPCGCGYVKGGNICALYQGSTDQWLMKIRWAVQNCQSFCSIVQKTIALANRRPAVSPKDLSDTVSSYQSQVVFADKYAANPQEILTVCKR